MILIRKNSVLFLLNRLATKCKIPVLFSSSQMGIPFYHFTSNANDLSHSTPFIVNYLIDSVGLSSIEANKASKLIGHIKSPSNPDSVRDFFRKNGFSDTGIRSIILSQPKLLCAKVDSTDSTVKPKLEILKDLGFSEVQFTKLVLLKDLGLLGFNDDIVKARSRNSSLVNYDLEKIKQKLDLFKKCQLSNEMIVSLVVNNQFILNKSLNFLKETVKRVNQLGIPCGSGMFYKTFCTLCRLNSRMIDAKFKVLESLGFSSAESLSAVSRQPSILRLSNENLSETIAFLVNKAGLEISYLSTHPSLVCLSLNKRLIPRNYVFQLIKEKGLLKQSYGFYNFVVLSEEKFMQKFIFSLQEKLPELHDVYLSASAGKFIN